MQIPQPHDMAPRYGGVGRNPVFTAAQVARMLRDAGARPDAVAAFVKQYQPYYSKPL